LLPRSDENPIRIDFCEEGKGSYLKNAYLGIDEELIHGGDVCMNLQLVSWSNS
jgi:hypothetical protein